MSIDICYDKIDKSNFYLGRISQVYRGNSVVQIENLSLLKHRKIRKESLLPSTINYLVVVDSVQGLFLGEVYQSKISGSANLHSSIHDGKTDMIYPEMSIDIIGFRKHGDKIFCLPEFLTVGITDKVYLANEEIIKCYLDSIEIEEKNKRVEERLPVFCSLLNYRDKEVSLKPSTLFDRHLMSVGTTNSGKSTSALSILDKIIQKRKKILFIDPTGEYKEAFDEQEVKKLVLGIDTVLPCSEISLQQWAILFEANRNTQGATLSDAIQSLRYQHKQGNDTVLMKNGESIQTVQGKLSSLRPEDRDFNVQLLAQQIVEESVVESKKTNGMYEYDTFRKNTNNYLIQKVNYQLNNTSILKFFQNSVSLKNLLNEIYAFISKPEVSLYIDASQIGIGDGIGGMIVDLISLYILNQNVKHPFIMFVDEIHRYTYLEYSDTEYYSGLTMLAREGRKKGVFLFLTTQNPQDVSPVLLGQVGTLLVHRLTHNDEIRTIQNHLDEYATKQIKKLNKGEAILTSINLLQNLYIKINKCERKHNNETPIL